MSHVDREKWDERYRAQETLPRRDPSPFLAETLGLIPTGRALDVACGAGRNALLLAEAGFTVDGFDVSPVGVEQARTEARLRDLDVRFEVVDLDTATLEERAYRLITVFRYMNRPLWPRLVEALTPDGWLVMEIHLQTPLPVSGPAPGPWRAEPNELLHAFRALRIVRYEEVVETSDREPDTATAVARLVACAGDPGW